MNRMHQAFASAMRGFGRARLILAALVLLAGACSRSPDGSPTDGQVTGGVYTNRYFGLSVTIPAGWTVSELKPSFVPPSNSPKPAAISSRDEPAHQLLMMSEKPLGAAGGANGSLLIMAEKLAGIPGVRSAKDYLARTSKLLIDAPVAYHPVAGIADLTIGSLPAYRLDFTARLAGNKSARQSYVICERHGYALAFILSGNTLADIQRTEGTLKTAAFH